MAANALECAWSATASASWVAVTAGSGSGKGTLKYTVDANPSESTRTATIGVAGQSYSITQNGQEVQRLAPVGFFDTPLDGAIVSGSVAVTGWALDDAGIARVEIWRDLVEGETTTPFNAPGHPGHGKVFIADAPFIRGARPDLQQHLQFGKYPNSDRAGWGYLMLTQGLANQGNGTFMLHAFAFDIDGQFTPLCAAKPSPESGMPDVCLSTAKRIVSDNSRATKPFGGLDTPLYGQTVSGQFWNYGWALTPNPNAADTRTCTILNNYVYMSIDSQPLRAVRYGETRTDIAAAFAGFSNGSASGGAFYIDTTAYANGDHTIGWYVVDNCGRADGVGSRFFSVLNGANITTEPPPPFAAGDAGDAAPIVVRRDGETRTSFPDDQGVHVVRIGQRSRLEFELPPYIVSGFSRTSAVSARYRGAEIVNGTQKPLPLGSTLDADQGIFYWAPVPGFLGSYELIFAAGDQAPVRVRIVIEP